MTDALLVIAVLVAAYLGMLYADALGELRKQRAEVARLRMSNRILLAAQRGRRRGARPIIAGRMVR